MLRPRLFETALISTHNRYVVADVRNSNLSLCLNIFHSNNFFTTDIWLIDAPAICILLSLLSYLCPHGRSCLIEFSNKKFVVLKSNILRKVIRGHSKRRPKMVIKTDYRLMRVKSIAECSKGSIVQYV